MNTFLFFVDLLLFQSLDSIPTCLIVETNETEARSFPLPADDNRTFASCSLTTLNEIENKMIIPFEFRRLHVEQPDHRTKYLNSERHQSFADGSTAVYEHRSNPDAVRYCRTCHDGVWTRLTVCQIIRCDAELLRANPRLVSEWGEVQPLDGGALYAPSSVIAVYTFALQAHCKRCETNGQWSQYALVEHCSEIKLFRPPLTTSSTSNQPYSVRKQHRGE